MKRIPRSVVAACLAALVPASASSKATELHFGTEPWHLALTLGGLKPSQGAPSSPDRQIFTFDDDRGTILSVIVENAHEPATMASCRNEFAQRTEAGMFNETKGEHGEGATQEFDLKFDLQGQPAVWHQAYSCRVRGTYYIDVHASRIRYRPTDHDALMALIDGVAIVD
jgi:hypothetical protein